MDQRKFSAAQSKLATFRSVGIRTCACSHRGLGCFLIRTDDQSQVSAAADVRYPNMNDRNQSQAGAPGSAGNGQQMVGNADAGHAARRPSNAACR